MSHNKQATSRGQSYHRETVPTSAPVIWLTGLSGAGKTTLAEALASELHSRGYLVEILDGDEIRSSLSSDLGFSKEDREKHNKRVIFLAKLLSRNGIIVLVPLISPYRHVRDLARSELPRFVEVWVRCSIGECIRRDPKGLYKKALAGEIKNFTGLDDPYEEPLSPELVIDTEEERLNECVDRIMDSVITDAEKRFVGSLAMRLVR